MTFHQLHCLPKGRSWLYAFFHLPFYDLSPKGSMVLTNDILNATSGILFVACSFWLRDHLGFCGYHQLPE